MRACGPVILAMVVCTAAAQAQSELEVFRIDTSEFKQHVKALQLGGDSLAAAEAMHDAWVIEFNDALVARRSTFDWLWNSFVGVFGDGQGQDDVLDKLLHRDCDRFSYFCEVQVRGLENEYFDRLLTISPENPEDVQRFRRAHLRKRKCDPKMPMLEQVAGVGMDVTALTLGAFPRARDDASMLAVLDVHETQLDQMLRRLDDVSWPHRQSIRSGFDRAREAIAASSPDLPRILDDLAELMVQRYEEYPAIRALNERSVRQITMMLPEPAASEFRDRAERQLHPYLFEHDKSAALRLQSLLVRKDLPDEKRQALAALERSLHAVRQTAANGIDSLYDATISVELYRSESRASLRRWAERGPPGEDPSEVASFNTAVEEWRQRERRFNADIAAVMGEPVTDDDIDPLIVLGDAAEIPADAMKYWDDTMSPDLSGGEFDRFLARIVPEDEEQEAMLRALYEDYARTYSREAPAMREKLRRIHARSLAYDRLNTDGWTNRPDFGWGQLDLSCRQRHREIESQFRDDMRSVLAGPQLEEWNRLERRLRRKRELTQQKFYQRIRDANDLMPFIEKLNLQENETEPVARMVNGYEVLLDAVLQEAETLRFKAIAVQAAQLAGGESAPSPEETARKYQEYLDSIGRARNVIIEHASSIAAAMNDANHQRFLDAVDRAAYPELFKTCPAELALDEIMKADVLGDDDLAAIRSIVETAQSTQDRLHRQIIAAIVAWQLPREVEKRTAIQQRMEAEGRDQWEAQMESQRGHPAGPLLKQRHDLVAASCAQVRGVIGEERLSSMPLAVRMLLSWWSPPEH